MFPYNSILKHQVFWSFQVLQKGHVNLKWIKDVSLYHKIININNKTKWSNTQ